MYDEILGNISEKTFYLQSLNNELNDVFANNFATELQSMFEVSSVFNFTRIRIFLFSLGWFLLSFEVGIAVICLMKRQYFREVYMITFLNTDMITKNKRVESYLQSLARSAASN